MWRQQATHLRKNPVDGSSFNIIVPDGMGPGSVLQVQPPQATSGAGSVPDATVCPTPKGSFREDAWCKIRASIHCVSYRPFLSMSTYLRSRMTEILVTGQN